MLRLLLAALLFVQSLEYVDSSPIPGARKGLKEEQLNRTLHYIEFNPETIEELMSTDHAMLEGDMILQADRNAVERTWPTHQIPYDISPELASRTDDILSAMATVSKHACVTFHKRTTEADYLLCQKSKGCASYVGFIGGVQPLYVGPRCIVGNIIHELLHALGFHHEHTRTDRGQYITILSHNIMTGMEINFKKKQGNTFSLPYDIASIMHYGSGFFSANGLPTIVPNKDVKEMGQRVKLTKLDIERIQHLYNCDATKKETEDTVIPTAAESEKVSLRTTSRHEPEDDHTPTAAAPPASLHHLNATTGGNSTTSREQAGTEP